MVRKVGAGARRKKTDGRRLRAPKKPVLKADLGRLINAKSLPRKLLEGVKAGRMLKVEGLRGGSAEFMLGQDRVAITATVRINRRTTKMVFKADGVRLPDKYLEQY